MIHELDIGRTIAANYLRTGRITQSSDRAKAKYEINTTDDFFRAHEAIKGQYGKLEDKPIKDAGAALLLGLALEVSDPTLRAQILTSLHNGGQSVGLLETRSETYEVKKNDDLRRQLADLAALRGIWAGLQMPVNDNYRSVNQDASSLRFPGGTEVATVGIAEIVQVRSDAERQLLFARYDAFMRTAVAAAAAGTVWPTSFTMERGGWSVKTQGQSIIISEQGKRTVTMDLSGTKPIIKSTGFEGPVSRLFGYQALEAMLVKDTATLLSKREIDPQVAAIFNRLLGPDGIFSPADLAPRPYRFGKPLLLCWDYNGTVEGRAGMAETTRDLQRMGVESVLTTSVSPESCERSMEAQGIHFNAYFGGNQVRSGGGNKTYSAIAAAYGIKLNDAPDRMVVIGDSSTDAPADLPGALFLNSDSRTPAEVLFSFLLLLDSQGKGSLADGMDKVLTKEGHFDIGLVSFDHSLERVNGNEVHTIKNLRANMSPGEMVDLLTPHPEVDAPNAFVHERMARRIAVDMVMSPADCQAVFEGLVSSNRDDLAAQLGRTWLNRRADEERRVFDRADKLDGSRYGFESEAGSLLGEINSARSWQALSKAAAEYRKSRIEPDKAVAEVRSWSEETVKLAEKAVAALKAGDKTPKVTHEDIVAAAMKLTASEIIKQLEGYTTGVGFQAAKDLDKALKDPFKKMGDTTDAFKKLAKEARPSIGLAYIDKYQDAMHAAVKAGEHDGDKDKPARMQEAIEATLKKLNERLPGEELPGPKLSDSTLEALRKAADSPIPDSSGARKELQAALLEVGEKRVAAAEKLVKAIIDGMPKALKAVRENAEAEITRADKLQAAVAGAKQRADDSEVVWARLAEKITPVERQVNERVAREQREAAVRKQADEERAARQRELSLGTIG